MYAIRSYYEMLVQHPVFEITYVATSEGGVSLESLHPSMHSVFTCKVEKADAKAIAERCQLAFP